MPNGMSIVSPVLKVKNIDKILAVSTIFLKVLLITGLEKPLTIYFIPGNEVKAVNQ